MQAAFCTGDVVNLFACCPRRVCEERKRDPDTCHLSMFFIQKCTWVHTPVLGSANCRESARKPRAVLFRGVHHLREYEMSSVHITPRRGTGGGSGAGTGRCLPGEEPEGC